MASHLLHLKHKVVGFDVYKPTLDRFREKGGQIATSPREAANNVFILMVANAQQVNSVLFDESDGAAQCELRAPNGHSSNANMGKHFQRTR